MILVDSNIILDIFTEDANWFNRSSALLQHLADNNSLCINPIIYSEISISFKVKEELDTILNDSYFEFLPITKEVAFLAGKSFLKYRKNSGTKHSTLPDFYIGAHAAILGIPLLTRDVTRYNHYFPSVKILHP